MTATTEAAPARTTRRTAERAEEAGKPGARKTATLHLPLVTVQFRAPQMHMPGRREMTDAGRTVTGFLPSPSRLAYYTGLGMVAAFGVIDWPVAVAIGAGTWIAQRGRREAAHEEEGGEQRAERTAGEQRAERKAGEEQAAEEKPARRSGRAKK